MSPPCFEAGEGEVRFPRVSGDEPGDVPLPSPPLLFSPRERG